jgi:hypothetical protein
MTEALSILGLGALSPVRTKGQIRAALASPLRGLSMAGYPVPLAGSGPGAARALLPAEAVGECNRDSRLVGAGTAREPTPTSFTDPLRFLFETRANTRG